MNRLAKAATALIVTTALSASSAGTAFANTTALETSDESSSFVSGKRSEEIKAGLDYVLQTKKPAVVRETSSTVEKEYEFSEGSTLTIVQDAKATIDVANPALSAGQDPNGFYIDMSPADQRSFINGGSALILASIGALMGPFAIAALPILGSYITPQLEGLTCANKNRTMRFYYTLDGNAVSSRCI